MPKTLQEWQNIHPDFTEQLVEEWKKWKFTPERCQEWLVVGLEITEAQFAKWFKNKGYITKEERRNKYSREKEKVFQLVEKDKLKTEYLSSWGVIHPDFAKKDVSGHTYQQVWEEIGIMNQDEANQWILMSFDPTSQSIKEIREWKNKGFNPKKFKEWYDVGLEIKESSLATYLEKNSFQPHNINNLSEIRKEFADWLKEKKDAQVWVNWFFPFEARKAIKSLFLDNKNLINSLTIENWFNLESIECGNNQLTSLTLTNCPRLKKVWVNFNLLNQLIIDNCLAISELSNQENQLTNLDFLTNLNKEKLIILNVSKNNFFPQDLSIFSEFDNLEKLYVDNNHFTGSLFPLQFLKKLNELDINGNYLNGGLEYLSESLEEFFCSETEFAEELEPYNGNVRAWKIDQEKKALESELSLTENRINVLQSLINEQKQKIINAYKAFAPEKELLQELIAVHLEYCRAGKQRNKNIIKLRQKRDEIRNKLESKLGEEFAIDIEYMLSDCESLIGWMNELDEQLAKRQKLVEDQKRLGITNINNNYYYEQSLISGGNFEGAQFFDKAFSQNTIQWNSLEENDKPEKTDWISPQVVIDQQAQFVEENLPEVISIPKKSSPIETKKQKLGELKAEYLQVQRKSEKEEIVKQLEKLLKVQQNSKPKKEAQGYLNKKREANKLSKIIQLNKEINDLENQNQFTAQIEQRNPLPPRNS